MAYRAPRLLLCTALAASITSVGPAGAQTKPSPQQKAFAAKAQAARKQLEALKQQTAVQAASTQKALAEAETAHAKILVSEAGDKKQALAIEAERIETMRQEAAFRFQAAMEVASTEMLLGVVTTSAAAASASEDLCFSEAKGAKPKLATAKRTLEGVIGSSAAAVSAAQAEEKKRTTPKVKQRLAMFGRDAQKLAKTAVAIAGTLAKLQEEAATLPPCP